MKNRDDVENLKTAWDLGHTICQGLPVCRDLEDTPGFEEYREELRQYREHAEAAWQAQQAEEEAREEAEWRSMIAATASKLDCNPTLAEYIVSLESCINDLGRRLERLELSN